MKSQRLWLTASAILIGVAAMLVQRQLAQVKQPAANQTQTHVDVAEPLSHSRLSDQLGVGQLRSFISAQQEFERRLVRDAPFSAELIIETVQPEKDGTSTPYQTAFVIYRDSQGRTRLDRMVEPSGSRATISNQPQVSVVNDHVAGFTYVLEHRYQLARRRQLLSASNFSSEETPLVAGSDKPAGAGKRYMMLPPEGSAGAGGKSDGAAAWSPGLKTTKEPLGERNIEGVLAEGTRSTQTIPARALGNRQPLMIVDERWYSSDLQTVVLIKHTDPRFGESVYRLTNISRTEPIPTVFVVPPDYKTKDEAASDLSPRD
jgi:hypothetical protein